MQLGTKIRQRRVSLDITQGDLAEDCGITQPSLSLIEGNKTNPTLLTTLSIASTLSMGLDDLFDGVTSIVGAELESSE